MSTVFPLNSKVRFTEARLSILTPRDRQGLEGRIGVVQTDGNLVQKPTVYFPADGSKLELRLFRVDPRHLELVDSTSPNANEPYFGEGAGEGNADRANPTMDTGTAAADGSDRLSQSEMDNLFD